jgi:hypothetical protein
MMTLGGERGAAGRGAACPAFLAGRRPHPGEGIRGQVRRG